MRLAARTALHMASLAGTALTLAVCPVATAQLCSGTWSDQFALAGTTAQISDTVIWDDGTGPALYAVGSFANRRIGRIDQFIQPGGGAASGAYNIARWDGRNWNIVGSTLITQPDAQFAVSRLNTIQVYDADGPGGNPSVLIVGGVSNGSSPDPCATLQFDGTTWTRFGQNLVTGVQEEIRDLEIFNGELYACGRFAPATGLTGIAKWDPAMQQWVDVAGGIPTATNFVRVERMAVGDADGVPGEELYVSGTFTFSATGGSAVKLVKWDGSSWSRVTGWTGTSTSNQANLGGPTLLKFMDIGDGPALLVGDAIYSGLVAPANTRGVALARLKNGVWSTMLPQTGTSSGNTKSYVYSAEMFDGPSGSQLHIGGTRLLNGVTGQPTGVSLARRTAGGTFQPLGTFPPTPATNTSTVAWMRPLDWDGAGPGGNKLLFGATQFRWGTIGTLSGLEPLGMALWNGSAVELAHSGAAALGVAATMFKELDPDGAGPLGVGMYIGHFSATAAGLPVSGLLKYDGTSYESTPIGITGVVAAEAFTPAGGATSLYAAGELPNANGPALVRLDGSAWTTVAQPSFDDNETQPQGIDALTNATIAGEPSLVVSGRFREMGGVTSRFVTRYNGTSWVAMDAGLPAPSGDPNELFRVNYFPVRVVNFNGELFVTVQHAIFYLSQLSETIFPARLYRWNGASWQDIGPGEGTLQVLDAGNGPRLYTIRNFQTAGDGSYIAEWNGSSFVQVGPGFNWFVPQASRSNIQALTVHDFGAGKRFVVALDGPGLSGLSDVSGLLYLENGQWLQVPGGELLSETPRLFSSSNPQWGGLYVGGSIRAIGGNAFNENGIESQGIARYINPTVPCNQAAPRCNPADIAYDDGSPLPPNGPAGGTNNGVTEGDYNLFFARFFDSDIAVDIANDDGSPLPPFGALATNNGVTEGDYNLFFSIFFDGCSF